MTASRFANATRGQAIAILFALTIAILVNIVRLPTPATPVIPAAPTQSASTGSSAVAKKENEDLILYSAIIHRIAAGEDYYRVAADEHRKGNYPLRPFITVRLPTLAIISAAFGTVAMTATLSALVLATMFAWWQKLARSYDDPGRRISALGLLAAGMVVAFWRDFIVLHELWAGVLLALAFGLHRPDRWLPSALLAACALFVRELSLPFLLLMGAFALWDRRWREAATLTAIIAAFALTMFAHAQQVATVTTTADLASPGWTTFGGWQSFIRTMQMPSVLRAFPTGLASAAIILSLFGWLSWRTRAGLFGTLLFTGYGVLFMMLGRADNFYWGFTVVPTFLIGLSFLPRAFADLRNAITGTAPKLDFAAR